MAYLLFLVVLMTLRPKGSACLSSRAGNFIISLSLVSILSSSNYHNNMQLLFLDYDYIYLYLMFIGIWTSVKGFILGHNNLGCSFLTELNVKEWINYYHLSLTAGRS